jgi:Tol biopolymer transport system component
MRPILHFALCLALLLFSACEDKGSLINGNDKPPRDTTKSPCPPEFFDPVYPAPYGSPVWHPDGRIAFNWTKILKIDRCTGGVNERDIDRDSSGFWMINPNGTGLRRLLPYGLDSPAWSPDGGWIAFGAGQIYKMRFTGIGFDTTTRTQLTFDGRNFFPAWSPDGQWIAYNKSICEGPKTCGVWLMTSAGTQRRFLAAYGNYPY